VVNVDIRDFTTFSETQDSVLALLYMRKVYERITSDYFGSKSFFKATGDGLLVVLPWADRDLQEVIAGVVDDCLRLVVEFPHICDNDPAINFDVPSAIGIGLARGSASMLHSRRRILDYSGRPLNLASRLMEVARPSGIVADGAFGLELLPDAVQDQFAPDEIYLRGIAESEPLTINFTEGYTEIASVHHQPIQEVEWETEVKDMTLREFDDRGPVFRWSLKSRPVDPDKIKAHLHTPMFKNGRRIEGSLVTRWPISVNYELDAGNPVLVATHPPIVTSVRSARVPWATPVSVVFKYPKG
jgi:class 3 adenylate cyclase